MSAATRNPNGLTGTIVFVLVTFLVIAGVIIAGLVVRPSGALDVPKGVHVAQVSVSNFTVKGPSSLPAGKYEVVVTNRGTVPHELVIFETKRPAAALPLEKDGSIEEDSEELTTVLDTGSSLAPGESRIVFGDLTSPGHYAMVCNLDGHYHLGMHEDLTVS